VTTGASISGSNSNTISGWLFGGGLEWAFASNWTLKAEYDYIGLNGRTFTIPAGSPFLAGDTFTTGGNNIQMATVGINFRFGGMYGM
jgi:outer membrane immunogenic protein